VVHIHSRISVSLAAFAIAIAGCSSDIVPVSGRVTLDGQPLSGATVTFQPVRDPSAEPPSAPGSVGVTDDQGNYELRLVDPDQAGALVGDHAVTISTAVAAAEGEPPQGERLPESWHDGSERFTVPAGGTSEANFDVVTPKTPPRPPAKKK
jgi:hypothetical protein